MLPPLQIVVFVLSGVISVIVLILSNAGAEVTDPQSSVIITWYSVPSTFCPFIPILLMVSKELFAPVISEKLPLGGFCCHW